MIFFVVTVISDNENEIRRKRKVLIDNSLDCKMLIYNYEESIINGNPIMTKKELNKRIDDILKVEKDDILESIKKRAEEEIENKRILRENRKVGYKYDLEIFKIFNNSKELSESQLKEGVKKQFNIFDQDKIDDLISIWKENSLISQCEWNTSKFKIGSILKYDFYKIDEEDIIWDEWLKKNRIFLKPDSKEYNEYYKINNEDDVYIPLNLDNN